MQTLTFLMLVLAGLANTYVVRERGHFWYSRPATIMVLASCADIAIVTSFAVFGVLMAPLSLPIVAGLFGATVAFAFFLDALKVRVFRHLRID